MLRTKRRSYMIAAASLFAVVFSLLGLVPVTPYVGVRSFLTFREVLSPLAGMLFGPLVGGASMVLGTFLDFTFGKPVVFDFLDFIPDLASAVLAGLVFTGRRKAALALPLVLIVWYSVDPLSAAFITIGGTAVPFTWMHMISVLTLAGAMVLESHGTINKLGPVFVGATVFASTMCGHIAGSIMYENILARVNDTLSAQTLQTAWGAIFVAYPLERVLFTVVGTAVAVPVLRAVTRIGRKPPTDSG